MVGSPEGYVKFLGSEGASSDRWERAEPRVAVASERPERRHPVTPIYNTERPMYDDCGLLRCKCYSWKQSSTASIMLGFRCVT